jgi:hypothetical protein
MVKTSSSTLLFTIKNPCIAGVKFEKKYLFTDKAEKNLHGFGTQNIVDCAGRYGGLVNFSNIGSEFTAEFVFYNIIGNVMSERMEIAVG